MDLFCEKCQEKLLFTNEIKEYPSPLFRCDICEDYLKIYYGVWHCKNIDCNYDICNLCKEGLKPHCSKCNGTLKFTIELSTYATGLFLCDHCNQTFQIKTGSHHCFNCNGKYDICIECRSKMI